jgi:probable HAF family extracellular repeat protein
MRDLGTLPGDAISEALGINEAGQVVGVSYGPGFSHPRAFVWQNEVMMDLNSLIPAGSTLTLQVAGDIDDRGEIAGTAFDSVTKTNPAFLVIPRRDEGDQ